MEKLKLVDIKKTYIMGDTKVDALKGISLDFEENGFVSILGPSGCGKTTMLNIIGGLDKYSSGNLIINGISTKDYKDRDWDAYRNSQIGFVFQSYNLISHQTVLQNVEIALTLTGVSAKERRKKAKEVLNQVGLKDQINKKPNQLSGGQMQRVAIARALVNNPNIILADEPTGALDSKTSVQIMELLKEIAKEKLVIMVTHNSDIAETYSNRIINLLDGKVLSDNEKKAKEKNNISNNKKESKKTAMSYYTALSLSFRNLLTKKNRTIITAIAGSIGIIGVALVLSLSNGLSSYISNMQSEQLAGFPITISTGEQSIEFRDAPPEGMFGKESSDYTKFPNKDILYNYDRNANTKLHKNIITNDYLKYVSDIEKELPNTINTITYTRGININLLAKVDNKTILYDLSGQSQMSSSEAMFIGSSTYFSEMPNNDDFILSLYDLIGEESRLPKEKNEIALVVDEYNRINTSFFEKLGISDQELKLTDFIGKPLLKVIPNNDFYNKSNGIYAAISANQYDLVYETSDGVELIVTGILRIKEGASSSFLSEGIVYTTALTDYIVEDAKASDIAKAQSNSDIDILTGLPFAKEELKDSRLIALGAETTPTAINIYPKDFNSKDDIKAYLDIYNDNKKQEEQILYSDMAESITNAIGTMINTVTYVLVGFAAISLVVSTIMIAIITYVSVIERTKEIGILRSVGARKKDITRIFNAETIIIGFVAGSLGVGIAYLLTIPINAIINNLVGIMGIASLSITSALMLIIGSMVLTLIAGFFPSRMASKKDPVIALRTE